MKNRCVLGRAPGIIANALRVTSGLAVMALATTVNGQQVRVEFWTDGPTPALSRTYASGQAIDDLPPVPDNISRVNVYSVGGLADIGAVVLNGSLPQGARNGSSQPAPKTGMPAGVSGEFDFVLGPGVIAIGTSSGPAGANFAGVVAAAGIQRYVRFSGAVTQNVTGPITVGRVTRLGAGGTISGSISASATGGDGIGLITAERIVGTLSITAPDSHINGILVNQEISLGASGVIAAKNGIADISAASMVAQVQAAAYGGDGDLNHLLCASGDFTGTISARRLIVADKGMAAGIVSIARALNGSILVRENAYGGIEIAGRNPATGQSADEIRVDGSFYGVIDANGDIGSVRIGGDVRLDTNSFLTPIIRSRFGGIRLLEVRGAIEGDVNLNTLVQAQRINTFRTGGDVRAIVTRFGGGYPVIKETDIGGSFTGELYLEDFETFRIRQDLKEASQVYKHGILPANRIMSIGRSLRGIIAIDQYLGLQGQVIINANEDPSGDWRPEGMVSLALPDGRLRFLTKAAYQASTDNFGGGAVGVVNFSLRPQECSPSPNVNAASVAGRRWPDGVIRETILLSLDGPVSISGVLPVTVERASAIQARSIERTFFAEPFADVTGQVRVIVQPTSQGRQIWIAPRTASEGGFGSFGGAYNYRITPRFVDGRSVLRCQGTNVPSGPSITPFVYEVTVDAFDIDRDGTTNTNDLLTWLSHPTDLNCDGRTTDADSSLLRQAIEMHR